MTTSGSVLDVNTIVSQLMAVEQAPLAKFDQKTASYQATLSAYGSLSGSVGVFQSALGGLTNASTFKALTATAGNSDMLSATANSKAASGNYQVNVTQLAQAQTLTTNGIASSKTAIGTGSKTTLFFQFGNTAGSYGMNGTSLDSTALAGGVSNGSLTINGKAIATGSATNSARALAEAINAQSTSTGVTATATAAESSATLFAGFGPVSVTGTGTYKLSVGGVEIAAQDANTAPGEEITATSLDVALGVNSPVRTALSNAGITVTGTAEAGDLKFTRADGSNLNIDEVVTGDVGEVQGGIGKAAGEANGGSSLKIASSITLTSSNGSPITVGGSNPAAAGLTAGTGGSYLSGGFTQDATIASGSVVIDSTNNSLEGIRDAINKAGIGVSASIVNDGSGTPYHLVLTSATSGNKGSMKISLSGSEGGDAETALADLLGYDPAGAQNMKQTSAAQDTKLTVNGIAISSSSSSVSEAIQGVTMNVKQLGTTTLSVNRDTNALKTSVTSFVKAYNDLNSSLKKLTGYDAETKVAGPLQGDAAARSVQSQVRRMLGASVNGLSGNLTTLGQIGITFDKDGTLKLDDAKLAGAIQNNFDDIAGLFAAIGTSTDNQVSFVSSTAATKPGKYDLNITQMATQGSLSSAAALAGPITIAADTTWGLTLNDSKPPVATNTATVTIPAGTYKTPEEFAKVLQSSINGTAAFSKRSASVAVTIDSDGKLVLSSTKYGSASNVGLTKLTGTDIADIFGGTTPVEGLDVAGTLGGHAVVGSGQTLTGKGGTDVEGLKIEITGGTVGDRGQVSFSQGYAYQLNNLATTFLSKTGPITSRTDGINSSIKSIAKQREAFADKLTSIEARYRAQYAKLDATLATMQSTSSYLTQQLAALAANS
ncbi:flagellar filament capping protein FliD [Pseudoduganella flava]|uniref:Flagellar hook-associated protein 2 n=1 Tax=Pseudoduganella flava TaxID=871742 RepID=A0ABX6G015_9BURK|nr:flagellar filament capping protein FliD [Pseudoduganella flava]